MSYYLHIDVVGESFVELLLRHEIGYSPHDSLVQFALVYRNSYKVIKRAVEVAKSAAVARHLASTNSVAKMLSESIQ